MRIALDFDQVIADYQGAKVNIAFEQFQVRVPKELMKSSTFKQEHQYAPLTLQSYLEVQSAALVTRSQKYLIPIEGALEGIQALISAGHYVHVVTSRSGDALLAATEWLESYGISVPATGVGKDQSKKQALIDLHADCFIDDFPKIFSDLGDVPVRLFQFGGSEPLFPYVTRVLSWQEFLQRLQ